MKAELNRDGVMTIYPETELECYALSIWGKWCCNATDQELREHLLVSMLSKEEQNDPETP